MYLFQCSGLGTDGVHILAFPSAHLVPGTVNIRGAKMLIVKVVQRKAQLAKQKLEIGLHYPILQSASLRNTLSRIPL